MNKRGNVLDVLFIVGLVFLVMLFVVIAVFFSSQVNNAIQASTVSSNAKTMTNNLETDFPGAVDFIVIMIMIGLPIGSMILAYFNNIHPFFFYLSVALMVLIVLVGYAYQSLWNNFVGTSLSNSASMLPMTNYIMTHFSLYTIIVCLFILFGSYVKTQNSGVYG